VANGTRLTAQPETTGPATMTAKFDKPLKRELMISGYAYVVTLSPERLKLVLKGKRKGYSLDWESLVSDGALAAGLNATLAKAPAPPPPSTPAKKTKKARR
jgi:hypothetical protein